MCWNKLRKHRSTILVILLLVFCAYIVLMDKLRENKELLERMQRAIPTLPLDIYEKLRELREKIVIIKLQKLRIVHELMNIRNELHNNDVSSFGRGLSLPSIINYLPNVTTDIAKPVVVVSKKRAGVLFAFGIPLSHRNRKFDVFKLLISMINGTTIRERQNIVIVLLIGDTDANYVNSVTNEIKKLFPIPLRSGLLEVISPPISYYPSFKNIPNIFDLPNIKQFPKENLDHGYLMMYAKTKAAFYMQMSGIATHLLPFYVNKIKYYVLQQETKKEWFQINFTNQPCSGNLFHSDDLRIIITFFLMFYKTKPCDWLIDQALSVKYCHHEKDICKQEKARIRMKYRPALFYAPLRRN